MSSLLAYRRINLYISAYGLKGILLIMSRVMYLEPPVLLGRGCNAER
jgi:hypothetical protein